MMRLAKRLTAAVSVLLMLASTAQADTYFYYRGGAQAGNQTGSPPPSPAPQGVFAVLVDGETVALRGTSYSATTYAYGNSGAVVFSIASGSLPSGIAVNPTTGTLSGMPASSGVSNFVVQGIDTATGNVATASFSIDVVDPFSISGTPAPNVLVGNAYTADFTLAGGGQPYGFSVGALPEGLTFSSSASTATITGSPSVPGAYPITVTGHESHGFTVQYPYTLTVVGPLSVAAAAPASATVGTNYSGQMLASGGVPPYSFTLAAGSLPTGIILTKATGVLSGKPTIAGLKSNIRISVADSSGQSVMSAPFSINVLPKGANQSLTVSGNPPATATENVGYSGQFTAGGGNGVYSYSIDQGALPPGLTLNATTGLISGAPLSGTRGNYAGIIVKVIDGLGSTAISQAFSIAVGIPPSLVVISGVPQASGVVGTPYASLFSASGGSGAGYVFSSVGTALPPGLSLDPVSGMLSGIPTVAGTYSGLKFRVTDGNNRTATSPSYTVVVNAPPALTIAGSPTANVAQGSAYSAAWTAFNGSGYGYHFTSVGAALPPGLTLSDANGAQGILSGIATVAGTYSGLQIQVEDSDGGIAQSPLFTILVVPPALEVAGNPAVSAELGVPYSAQFNATGGSGAGYSFSIATGALPQGLTITSSGLISGTPTVAGTFPNIVVRVTDNATNTAHAAPFNLTVTDTAPIILSWAPQTDWTVGDAFEAVLTSSGGQAALAFGHTGTLPNGVSQDPATGSLIGVPTTAGMFGPVALTATDGLRTASTDPIIFNVVYSGVSVAGTPAPVTTVGDAYSAQFTATGGAGGYVYEMVGTLPAGLTLDGATGAISGSASVAGTFSGLAVKATDAAAQSAISSSFSITVRGALAIAGAPAANATVDTAYSAQFTATGGTLPYVYSMIGTLPNGLTLGASNGRITGSPTTVGAFSNLAVKVADSDGHEVTSDGFSIVVGEALAVAGTPQTQVGNGQSYSSTFTATGGSGHGYVWSVTGLLPDGITMDPATGVLSGTSTDSGTYAGLRAKVTDSDGASATSAVFSITVAVPIPALAIAGNPATTAALGDVYSAQFTATGGVSPYAYSMVGTLPDGLILDGVTGKISGTPTVAGTASGLAVKVADDAGHEATSSVFSITVAAPLTVSGTPPASIGNGQPYTATFTASGGSGTGYTWSVTGTLPSGITINATTGVLSGSSTAAGVYSNLRAKVTDSDGASATSAVFSIVVGPALAIAGNPSTAVSTGDSYSATWTISGGTTPYAVTSSALPEGLSLTSTANTATVSGSIATEGSYPITVTATDDAGKSVSASYTLVVGGALAVDPIANVSLREGDTVNIQVHATGGTGPYTYQAYGSFPPGIAFDGETGAFVGTAISEDGSIYEYSDIYVKVTDAANNTVQTPSFSMTVTSPLFLSGMADASVKVGDYYDDYFSIFGGDGNYSVSAPGLPDGLTVELDGSDVFISGNPTLAGVHEITVNVSDGSGQTASLTYALDVIAPSTTPIVVAGTPPASVVLHQSYSAEFTATGGTGAGYTWSVNEEALPAGLILDPATGVLHGTPYLDDGYDVGTYAGIVVTATDPSGTSGSSEPFSIEVLDDTTPVSIEADVPETARVEQPYSAQFTASGGNGGPYYYELETGWDSIPSGLSLDRDTGILSGVVDIGSGSDWRNPYSGIVFAADSDGNWSDSWFQISVLDQIRVAMSNQTIEEGHQVDYYYIFAAATGGDEEFTYEMVGTLPDGVSLDTNSGQLIGIAPLGSAGTYSNLRIKATDSEGYTGQSDPFDLTVSPGVAPPVLEVGAPMDSQYMAFSSLYFILGASNGDGNYTFDVLGTLPPGLTYSSANHMVSGTPGAAAIGEWPITLKVTDGTGATATSDRVIKIVTSPIAVSGGTPMTATEGTSYSARWIGNWGSRTGYVFEVIGTLPDGLSMNSSTGYITGTPTVGSAGFYDNLKVKVTDSVGQVGFSDVFGILVRQQTSTAPLTLTGSVPATAVQSFTAYFYAEGGSGAGYTFSATYDESYISASINASTGIMTSYGGAIGPHQITVTVKDSLGATDTKTFTISLSGYLAINTPDDINAVVGSPLSPDVFVQASGGSGGYTYGLYTVQPSPSELPAGLSINPTTGKIEGIPTAPSDVGKLYRVMVTDSSGGTTYSNYFRITVIGPLALVGVPQSDAWVGEDYQSTNPRTQGGEGSSYLNTYTLVAGNLPPGLSLDSHGYVTGVPNVSGTYSGIRIQVTDGSNNTALSEAFEITVHPSRKDNYDGVYAWFDRSASLGLNYVGFDMTPFTETSVGIGGAISLDAKASGGKGGPYTFAFAPGYPVPPGLSINSVTGHVSGSIATVGRYRLVVRATDVPSGRAGNTEAMSIVVAPVAIAGGDVEIMIGESVNVAPTTTGGRAPFTYKLGGGSLPNGVSINPSTGGVSGTTGAGAGGGSSPVGNAGSSASSTAGTGLYTYSVFVTDADGNTADSGPMSIMVNGANGCMYGALGPYGVIGRGPVGEIKGRLWPVIYAPEVLEMGGSYRNVWHGPNYAVDWIPTFNNGAMTPQESYNGNDAWPYGQDENYPRGMYGPFTVEFWNAESAPRWNPVPRCGVLGPYYVDMVDPVVLDYPDYPDVIAGAYFSTSLHAQGGKRNSRYWYTAVGLPSGLKIDNNTGVISGYPSGSGYHAVTVRAMDGYGIADQKTMYINVRPH